MPALFGIVCNEGIVSDVEIAAMQKTYSREDRETELYRISEKVVLGCCRSKFNRDNTCFFKSNNERNISVLATARLDNRPELQKLLALTEFTDIADSECIYYAYLKWGTDAVKYLKGDWSFAAWEQNEQSLMVARDQYGVTSMYYAMKGDTLYFSSLIKAISAFDYFKSKINYRRLAEIVCGYYSDGYSTFFENINILSVAHYIRYNGAIQKVKYWQPTVNIVKNRNEVDVYEEFRFLFRNAVERRLPKYGNLGIMQSGGLDSSAVAAVAALIEAEKGRNVYCYTSVPKYDVSDFPMKHRNPDEGEIASSLAKMYPNIVHKLINDGPYTVLSAIDQAIEAHGQPTNQVINAHWIFNLLDTAKRDGCTTVMSGQHGNYSISWPPWRIEHNGLKHFAKAFFYYFKKESNYDTKERSKLFFELTNNQLHRYIGDIENERAERLRQFQKFTFKEKQINSFMFDRNIAGLQMSENAFHLDINISDPTSDLDLIQFCLSLPEEVYVSKLNSRLLVKRALKEFLPVEIINQQQRGRQNADIFHRLSCLLDQNNMENYNSKELFNFTDFKSKFQEVIEEDNYNFIKLNVLLRCFTLNNFMEMKFGLKSENYKK